MLVENKPYTGPLFIIGMPRSGTKLLRSLLNGHPMINIATIETQFLPCWSCNWDTYGDLSEERIFKKFYIKCLDLSYFTYMKRDGKLIERKVWYDNCENFSLSGVFEALIRHDVRVDYCSNKIWGDKSPSYVRCLPLLKKNFPEARFIHIIRDVRDYCLSINHAWGKNMFRAAQRWTNDIQKCKYDSTGFSNDYFELKFENLIENTTYELERVCSFLNVDFCPTMLNLAQPTENFGLAKGQKEIITNNKGKYHYLMDRKKRFIIECIAVSVLDSYGYCVDKDSKKVVRLSRFKMLYYQVLDCFNLFKYRMRDVNFITALKFSLRQFAILRNRN